MASKPQLEHEWKPSQAISRAQNKVFKRPFDDVIDSNSVVLVRLSNGWC
jgi:hypothetical protein